MEWLRPNDEAPARTPIDYDVFYGTNRKPIASGSGAGFLNERGSALALGRCRVSVPTTHRFGSNGARWLSRFRRCSRDSLDVVETESLDVGEFLLRVAASSGDFDCRLQNLLYIHGYRVSFNDAITQAAQLGVDLKIPGRTFAYCWPSAARLGQYVADEAALEASIPFLEQFVAMVRSQCVDVPLNVLVHSMGSRAILRLLAKVATEATGAANAPIGQVIFVAPDVDRDVFASAASQFSGIAKRTTLYAARADVALQVSEWLHNYPRAGLAPPLLTAEGIDTVLVEDFDLLSLGHDYHSSASAVLHDMFHLIRYDSSPHDRPAIKEASSEDGRHFWKLSVA
jgi:esterase/lipase superfamily enzyme